ncbi:iron ABC transporter permease [Paeniglutamicibacter psychrophenolicus]|uniref:Iron complex transport system permease protein n=1 Tax=Paeniglutamicibacter psychrophenolicus TaxID=257454 RepID=A0ABS4WBS6_9MICC|nr:iron complex transport system permease protein [Paeniglutamicibacter psychrophenolicus]
MSRQMLSGVGDTAEAAPAMKRAEVPGAPSGGPPPGATRSKPRHTPGPPHQSTPRPGRRIGPVARVNLLAAAGIVVAVLLNLVAGRHPIAIDDLLAALAGERVPGVSFMLWEDRLPQAAVGVLAGAAFGASGAIFQRMLRNPLASPDVIGVGYGASAAAVAGMLFFGAQGIGLSLIACAGALAVALLIYAIADAGKHTGARLILAGIAVAAMLQGIISYLLTRTDIRMASDALRWLTGSLSASTWDRAGLLGAALAILLPLLVPAAAKLRILELGDDTAAGLGLGVRSTRLGLILLGVGLCAVATAVTGPLAFVAFLAGPLALRLCNGRSHLGSAAGIGALLVVSATFIATNILPDIQLPVGVVTGALGAPFLIWVLVRSNKEGT